MRSTAKGREDDASINIITTTTITNAVLFMFCNILLAMLISTTPQHFVIDFARKFVTIFREKGVEG